MKRLKCLALGLLPLLLGAVLFLGVLRAGPTPAPIRTSIPVEAMHEQRCTWHCHNHGCPHRPVLPSILSSDEGLFGETIRALRYAGHALSDDARLGYGLANLLIFCVGWPSVTYGLWLTALWQRRSRL